MTVADFHCHWYPERYLRSILDRREVPRTVRVGDGYRFEGVGDDVRLLTREFFDLEVQLESMEQVGIGTMVASPNLVGDVGTLPVGEAKDITAMLNEEYSEAQKRYPGRFRGLAMVPIQSVEDARDTLDDAIQRLTLAGVCLITHVAGEPIATKERLPFFEKVDDLRVPIFLHPSHRSSIYRPGQPRPIEAGLNWVYDTSLAALSLMFSGTLDACPHLEVVHPHVGGVLPYVLGRIASTTQRRHMVVEGLPEVERAPDEYLRTSFYIDSVGQTRHAMDLAITEYGVERLLFGTDFPWQQPRQARRAFVEEELDEETAKRVLERNRPSLLSLSPGER